MQHNAHIGELPGQRVMPVSQQDVGIRLSLSHPKVRPISVRQSSILSRTARTCAIAASTKGAAAFHSMGSDASKSKSQSSDKVLHAAPTALRSTSAARICLAKTWRSGPVSQSIPPARHAEIEDLVERYVSDAKSARGRIVQNGVRQRSGIIGHWQAAVRRVMVIAV